ncbi:hypothetical protein AAFM48_19685 [Burkholderia pseudomallei]
MKSDSAIFSFIENFPTSASLKTADTGKYIANNIHNSIQFGIKNPKDLEGLTIQDVKFNQKDWGIRYAQLIQDLDRSARENKSHVMGRHQFLDDWGGTGRGDDKISHTWIQRKHTWDRNLQK